jgi:Xaa-Pro aminopeptidase
VQTTEASFGSSARGDKGVFGNGQQLFDRAKATRLMEEAGVDLLLPHTTLNAGYLADFYFYNVANMPYYMSEDQELYTFFVGLPADPSVDSFMLGRTGGNAFDIGYIDPWIEDRYLFGPAEPAAVRVAPAKSWRPVSPMPVDAAALAIRDRKLERATIGVEMPWLGASILAQLQGLLPHARFVDATSLLARLRMIKCPEEIRRMEVAADAARRTHWRLRSALREGMTGFEIDRVIQSSFAELGVAPEFREIHPNVEAAMIFCPSPIAVTRGDSITIDLGARYLSYVSDMARNYCVGEPTPEIASLHAVMKESFEAILAECRPGVECSHLYEVGMRAFRKSGRQMAYSLLGHGLGRDTHEIPCLSASDHTVMEPGLAFTIELPMFIPGVGSVQLEDDFVITENGCRALAPSSLDIMEVA